MGIFYIQVLHIAYIQRLYVHVQYIYLHSQKRAICNQSIDNKPISGFVRMACKTACCSSLLQVVNFTDLLQLVDKLLQLVDKLQQAC